MLPNRIQRAPEERKFCECVAKRSLEPTQYFFPLCSVTVVGQLRLILSTGCTMRSQHFGIEKFIALSCFHLFRDVYNFVTSDHTHTHSNKTPRANEEPNTTTATKTGQKKVR